MMGVLIPPKPQPVVSKSKRLVGPWLEASLLLLRLTGIIVGTIVFPQGSFDYDFVHEANLVN